MVERRDELWQDEAGKEGLWWIVMVAVMSFTGQAGSFCSISLRYFVDGD